MPENVWLDVEEGVAALLDEAASIHEAAGRGELAVHHRGAAADLRRASAAA